jgi:tripartite-type tricarboxylate transporter receptor subunit TctC
MLKGNEMFKKFIVAVFWLALLGLAPWSIAQEFPSKTVRIVVGSGAGSTPDVFARSLAQKLSETWGGSPVVVENRPGAAGVLAADYVVKSAPDGYTLLFSDNSTWSIDPHLFSKLPYDPLKDLVPVVQVGVLPVFLIVNESMPVSSVQELIAYLKKNPGKFHYGSAGPGSMHHLSAERFKSLTGTDIVHVPYKGAAQVGTAIFAGEVQLAFMGYTSASPAIQAGKAKVLAVGTEKRVPNLPAIPTLEEGGVKGFYMSANVGINAPAGTPAPIIARIASAVSSALKAPDVAAKLAELGIVTTPTSTPEEFARTVRSDYEKFGLLVKQVGAKVD